MKKRTMLSTIVLLIGAGLMLTGCGSDGQSETATSEAKTEVKTETTKSVAYKDTLNVAYSLQPGTFDPMVTGATATAEIDHLVFESLFEMDHNGDAKPQLCESFTKSDDNKDWTFKLREGVLFHNGEEMKAKDVAASLNRWIKKNTIVQRSIKDGEQFVVIDDYTVGINLHNPCLMLPEMLAQYSQMAAILPASVIESVGDGTLQKEDLIGTGSFVFTEWAVDNYYKLTAFDGYRPFTSEKDGMWGDRTPGVKELKIYVITDPQTRINGLETGEYDIAASLSWNDIPRLKNMADVKMLTENYNVLTVTMNKSSDSIMSQPKWRQVIGYAINLDEIMEGAIPTIDGHTSYIADSSYFGVDSPWYSASEKTVSYNPAKAKELIAELKYDGTPLKMMTTEAYPEFYNATLIMKQQLEAVGLNVDFQVLDWGTMLTRLGQTDTFDLYPMNYPFADNPTSNMTLMKTNASGFTNDPHLNELMAELQALPSVEEAKAFWKDIIQPYCAEQVFIINLGSYDYIYGVSDKVEDFTPFYGLSLWGVKVTE